MSAPSAMFGHEPNNEHDYWIIKGLYRIAGVPDADAFAGYKFAPQPPPGYVHETKITSVVVGCSLVIAAILIPTVTRLILRARSGSVLRFGWDDWTIIVAAIVGLGYPITEIILPALGAAAVHTWELTYEQYNYGAHGLVASKIVFFVAVGLTKLSITLFVRRMAQNASRLWQAVIDIFLILIVAYIVGALFAIVFACDPAPAQWDLAYSGKLPSNPTCVNVLVQSRVLSGLHIGQGVILLSMPIIILWRVKMDVAKKTRLFIVWSVGGLAVTCSLLREVRPQPFITMDISWDYTEDLIWTSVDLTMGYLVASLPVMDGLLAEGWSKAADRITGNGGLNGQSRSKGSSKDQHSLGNETNNNNKNNNNNTNNTEPKYPKKKPSKLSLRNNNTNNGGSPRGRSDKSSRTARSESTESIMPREPSSPVQQQAAPRPSGEDLEMGIMCTQEIEVLYSTRAQLQGEGVTTPRREHYLDREEWKDKNPASSSSSSGPGSESSSSDVVGETTGQPAKAALARKLSKKKKESPAASSDSA